MPSTTPTPAVLTTPDAAAYLGVSERTLEGWRGRGEGPPWSKFGGAKTSPVRYRVVSLDAWLAERERTSTAEPVHSFPSRATKSGKASDRRHLKAALRKAGQPAGPRAGR